MRRRSPTRAPRRKACAQAARDKLAAEADAKRKALEDELAAKLAAAERQIAATRATAMANVASIARDAAGAIVERLVGRPADADAIAAAVASVKSLSRSRMMEFDAEFFVLLGFLVFLCLLVYLGVHRMVLKALDARGEAIADELAQAAKLREEASALLASFEKKAAEAEASAAAIVADARAQAEQSPRRPRNGWRISSPGAPSRPRRRSPSPRRRPPPTCAPPPPITLRRPPRSCCAIKRREPRARTWWRATSARSGAVSHSSRKWGEVAPSIRVKLCGRFWP